MCSSDLGGTKLDVEEQRFNSYDSREKRRAIFQQPMNPDANFEPGFKKTVRWTLFTDGAIIILIGALGALGLFLQSPSLSKNTIGVGLLVSGLNYLVPYISLKNSPIRPRWFILIGALNAVFGVLFLTGVWRLLFKLQVLAGVWMIFAACARAFMAFENFKSGVGKWWITLTVGAYLLFAASTMLADTSEGVRFISWSAMIVSGMFIINEGRKLFGEEKSAKISE